MTEFLDLDKIEQFSFGKKEFLVSREAYHNISKSFDFLVNFSNNKIIYGINTGFGPMVQYKIEEKDLNQLQYNLIRSHSSGTGFALNEVYGRSVVLARLTIFCRETQV